ncbi:hypothetical protein J3R83DRAFT_10391 [Lanmaoa asiatica]|nr:hypothetical protein J3R83DRAFT_10391 [Lanmaoa asiatica]
MSAVINVRTIHQPHGFTLDTLDFSVCFRGNLPVEDAPDYIPMEISIRIADDGTGFLPVVNVASHKPARSDILNPAMFPFLPLPADFEPDNASHWQRLSKVIESCLVAGTSLESRYPEAYSVMRDLFWMAFVASFPTFPGGNWPLWDTRISMEGGFISSWVRRDEVEGILVVQEAIWGQFKTTVECMLLIPAVVQLL